MPQSKRIIVVGCREKWDREALGKIARWAKYEGKHDLIQARTDHYDMATKPRKGDAYEALLEHKDTVAVVALHLYGLDEKKAKAYAAVNDYTGYGYRYTKHNHRFLAACLKRSIPFIVVGDQPIDECAKLPKGILRTTVSLTWLSKTQWRPIYVYERAR